MTKTIIKLYCNAEEIARWDKKRAKLMADTDEDTDEDTGSDTEENDIDIDNEEIIKKAAPKAILQKVLDNDTQIVTPGDGIISKMFTYEEADVLVLMDEQKKAWYKGKDIATILEYVNTKAALITNVSKKYKTPYRNLRVISNDPLKIHPQTIFIDNSGLFELITKSKKKEAISFYEFITDKVIPELLATGTYTLPIKVSDIERLNKSFYDDNSLSDYENTAVVYLAYIGEYNGKYKIKWGNSENFVRRDLKEHRNTFKVFNVMGIWKTLAHLAVERKMKINFESKNMVTPLTLKTKVKGISKKSRKVEIITLNEVNNLDYCLNMIENVVKNTIPVQELKYIETIKELKRTQIKSENNHAYEILKLNYNIAENRIKQLEKTLRDIYKANPKLRQDV